MFVKAHTMPQVSENFMRQNAACIFKGLLVEKNFVAVTGVKAKEGKN